MPTETDPIRKAQGIAVVQIQRLMAELRATPNEVLLSLDLPIKNAEGIPSEDAPEHIKNASIRFRQLAKLFINLKQDIQKIYADAH